MEKDDEIKGENNSYDFGARIYDPRVGRWLSLDPLQAKYPHLSPYAYVANSPILMIDKDGKDIWIVMVENTMYPSEMFGHNSLYLENEGEVWYYSAGGKSFPRKEKTYEIRFFDGVSMETEKRSYKTPDGDGIISQYNREDRKVVMGRFVVPKSINEKKVEKYIKEQIIYASKNYGQDCDNRSGTCTLRVKGLLTEALIMGGMEDEAAAEYVDNYLGSIPNEDPTEDELKEAGYDKSRTYTPDEESKNENGEYESSTVEEDDL